MNLQKFSCVIVDDEPDAIELLASRLSKLYENINIVATYSNWQDALQALRNSKFDILFMDISIPGKTGINILKLVPDVDYEIIFVTAHDNYAVDAFNLAATGYILKPVDDAELMQAVDKAQERALFKKQARIAEVSGRQATSGKVAIPHYSGFDYMSYNDIIYLESVNKLTKVVTIHDEINSTNSLARFQFLIDEYSFFQTHRSFIINLNHILRYESAGVIVMKNKAEIPLSRSARTEFLSIYR